MHTTRTNMATTSFTLVGNSADSQGLADVPPCIAHCLMPRLQSDGAQRSLRHAAGGVAAMWSSNVASESGAVMCTLWLASISK